MKYLTYGLLPALVVVLVLGGCSTLEHGPEAAPADRTPKATPRADRVEIAQAGTAAPIDANAKPARAIQLANR